MREFVQEVEAHILPSKNIHLLRVTGIAAITAPAMLWVMFLGLGFSRPDYNLLTAAASNLGARGTANAELFNVGFFVTGGFLTALAGIGFLRMMGTKPLWRVGAFLTVIAGMFLMLTGLFPTAGAGSEAHSLHVFFSQSCFIAASIAPLLMYLGLPSSIVPPWAKTIWLSAAIATIGIELFEVFINRWVGLPYGFFQRTFLLALSLSFMTVGAWLVRHRPHEHSHATKSQLSMNL